jgi:hypothetical protein
MLTTPLPTGRKIEAWKQVCATQVRSHPSFRCGEGVFRRPRGTAPPDGCSGVAMWRVVHEHVRSAQRPRWTMLRDCIRKGPPSSGREPRRGHLPRPKHGHVLQISSVPPPPYSISSPQAPDHETSIHAHLGRRGRAGRLRGRRAERHARLRNGGEHAVRAEGADLLPGRRRGPPSRLRAAPAGGNHLHHHAERAGPELRGGLSGGDRPLRVVRDRLPGRVSWRRGRGCTASGSPPTTGRG